jgi:hypothetical protein
MPPWIQPVKKRRAAWQFHGNNPGDSMMSAVESPPERLIGRIVLGLLRYFGSSL